MSKPLSHRQRAAMNHARSIKAAMRGARLSRQARQTLKANNDTKGAK